jgi:hypothetical protein
MNTTKMQALFAFVDTMCKRYNIDESHGLKHAKGTVVRAQMILNTLPDVTDSERRIAIYSAALHDTCDHKYTDVKEASLMIDAWLEGAVGWPFEERKALLSIITSMSYSMLKKMNPVAGLDPRYPDHGKWSRAYHVARSADVLESYIVARCVLYNQHIYPSWTEDQHWARAEELFKERVFQYRHERWLQIPEAVKQSIQLEEEAVRCLKERDMTWEEPLLESIQTPK